MKIFLLLMCFFWMAGCTAQSEAPEPSLPPSDAVLTWVPKLDRVLEEIGIMQENAVTQRDMTSSAFLEFEVLDASLYIEMMDYAQYCSVEDKTKLFESHYEWLKNRDTAGKNARLEYEGGSMAPLIEATTLSRATEKRLAAFSELSRDGLCPFPTDNTVSLDSGSIDNPDASN